jgi:hypothetical protein
MVHGYLARLLDVDVQVRQAALVVRFETLCAAPADTLRGVFEHCRLPDAEALVARYAANIRPPDYYRNPLSPADLEMIAAETAATARLWGY